LLIQNVELDLILCQCRGE